MPLTHVNANTIKRVASLAESLSSAFPPSEGGLDFFDPNRRSALAAFQKSAGFVALNNFLHALSEDELAEVTAVIWLGRGDVEGRLEDFVSDAKKINDSKDLKVRYITDMFRAVPSYIQAGLPKIP